MALITENINKNAEICKNFVGGTLTDILKKMDKNSTLDFFDIVDEVEALVKAVAKLAPYREEFEKVYGADPYTYYMKEYKRKK